MLEANRRLYQWSTRLCCYILGPVDRSSKAHVLQLNKATHPACAINTYSVETNAHVLLRVAGLPRRGPEFEDGENRLPKALAKINLELEFLDRHNSVPGQRTFPRELLVALHRICLLIERRGDCC